MSFSRQSLLIASLLIPTTAWAVDGSCPEDYDPASCNDICTTSGTTWTCDLVANGDGVAAEASVVSDFADFEGFSAWGTDASGGDFCCTHDPADLREVVVLGGSAGDDISLIYDVYELEVGDSGSLAVQVWGGSGDDDIKGSSCTDSAYSESLNGQEDDDFIYGGGGADDIAGGAGADRIDAGPGDDVVYGGLGDDVIVGSAGADTLYGQRGEDVICGGVGEDRLYGNPGDDTIWDADESFTADGGADFDTCSPYDPAFCESELTLLPAECMVVTEAASR